ncbi:MAG: hypothetical protein ACOCRK_07345 [bacterium]
MYDSIVSAEDKIRLNKLKDVVSKYEFTKQEKTYIEKNRVDATILIRSQVKNIGDILYTIEEDILNKVEYKKFEFSSEEQFTKLAVIPYLESQNYNDVTYNHGPEEYGKDVVYSYIDELGDTSFGAALVKLDKISGSAGGNLNEVINQIEMAFQIPFDFKKISGGKNCINRLLVISAGNITAHAKKRIENSKRINEYVRNLKYINGEEVIREIQKNKRY